MVFHLGTALPQNARRSVIKRRLGRGGKRYVPRAMYSFRMSFWTVPESFPQSTPCLRATASTIASSTGAVALMVMDTETLSSGMPARSVSMSSTVSIATPTLPTSPVAIRSSES